MRKSFAFAAALLATLALALAACTGGGPPPAATPEAPPAAETPSAPAPTAEASSAPTPAPTPEPPPEAACASGVAVAEPEANPGLVADCVALLATGNAVHAPPLARTTESEWRDALELEASGLAPGDCPAQPVPASEGGPCVPARYTAACSKGTAVPDPQANSGLVRDCALLLLARDPLRGTAPLNWSEDLPIAEWDGVGVNGDPPRVDGVHLRNKGLDGVIPHWLGGLTELVYLHFGARNYLTGPIPPELANLPKLGQFYAGGRNTLTGPIPAEFGNLRDLAILYLTNNRLTGVIPDLSGTNLKRLELRNNDLTGGIPEWLGEMTNLYVLSLSGNALTGPIPRSIGRLPRLSEVRLARNALTGCVPSPLEDVAPGNRWNNDVAELGLPWCLRYNALDATGAVATAGSWAILDAGGGVSGQAEAPPAVIATWEGLRSEAATLRVHQTDAAGTSWAAEFGAVSEGGLFEWRKASDCWVRYRVTGDPVRPAAGSGRWEFPVEWMTYAATGEGCTGAVGSSAVLGADEEPLAVIRSLSIASPVRHGPFLLYPTGWTGVLEERVRHAAPAAGASGVASAAATPSPYLFTTDVAEARRQIPHWREPTLPAGWTFGHAESGTHNSPFIGYCAMYLNGKGYDGGRICARYKSHRPQRQPAVEGSGKVAWEMHVLDGHAALARYSPQGAFHSPYVSVVVWVFDPESGIEYAVEGYSSILIGSDTAAAIAIARSLLSSPEAP